VFLKILRAISEIIGFLNRSIAIIGIAGGVALAFYNVVARYVFKSSLTWAGELTVYLFLWSAFFGAAYCFKKDAHISITILLDKLPPKISKILMIISHIITLIFLLAVAWYGYEYIKVVIELEERSIDLDIPMWIPYLAIPLSFSFGAWRVAEKLLIIIKTPAEKILRESEAEMIIAELEEGANEKLLKEVKSKTKGLL
jgi:C4-dicarboxylate transporter DctQ subunit